MKKSTSECDADFYVVLPGFEPRQAEPKTAVLPLHHKTILILKDSSSQKRCKVIAFYLKKQAIGLLFCDYQVIILLAFLGQDIFTVQ